MDDLISREDAIKSAVHALCDFFGYDEDDFEFPVTNTDYLVRAIRKNIISSINALPSAEEKTGEWIELDPDDDKYDNIKCGCCKKEFTVDAYHWVDIGFTKDDMKFCPHCGAKMEEKNNERWKS